MKTNTDSIIVIALFATLALATAANTASITP